MILEGNPGWGIPVGVHGELSVEGMLSDDEIKNFIKQRLATDKIFVDVYMIKFKRLDDNRVAFEIMK